MLVNYISSLFFGVSLTRCRGLKAQPTSAIESFSLFLLCSFSVPSLIPSVSQVPPSTPSVCDCSLVLSQNSTRVHVHLLLYATPT